MKTIQILIIVCGIVLGCKAQAPCNPTNSPSFQLSITQLTLSANGFCGAQINVLNATASTPGAGVNFLFFKPGQTNPVVPIPSLITAGGVWTVTVYELPSACATSKTIQINVLPAPVLTVTATNTLFCTGQEATLTASGANSYIWHTGATTASLAVIPPPILIYSLTGMGSNGCANVSSGTINVNLSPTVTATANQTAICINQNLHLKAQGANTFTWNNSVTGILFASPQYTAIGNFIYTVQIQGTANQGCVTTKTVTLSVLVEVCDVGFENKDLRLYPENFKLFPNPTSSYVIVNLATAKRRILDIENFQGTLLRRYTCEEDAMKIEISELSKGIYFLKICDNSSVTYLKFIIE